MSLHVTELFMGVLQYYINHEILFRWMVEGTKMDYHKNTTNKLILKAAKIDYDEDIVIDQGIMENVKINYQGDMIPGQYILTDDKLEQFLDNHLIIDDRYCIKAKKVLELYQKDINTTPNAVTDFCKKLRLKGYNVKPKGSTGENRTQHIWGYKLREVTPVDTLAS